MPREGIDYPGWFNRAACSIRCELSKLWSAVGTKLSKINTVEPDGDGKVKIVSDTVNLTVTDDQGNNAIRLDLDPGLSSPPVTSVNGETGAVVLDNTEISGSYAKYDGSMLTVIPSASVQVAINQNAQGAKNGDDALRTRMTAAETAISTEASDRATADNALAAQIATKAGIGDTVVQNPVAAQSIAGYDLEIQEDLDVDGNVTIGVDLGVGGDVNVTGDVTADSIDANLTGDALTDASAAAQIVVNADTSLVRTTGNQTIAGTKTFDVNPVNTIDYIINNGSNGWYKVYEYTGYANFFTDIYLNQGDCFMFRIGWRSQTMRSYFLSTRGGAVAGLLRVTKDSSNKVILWINTGQINVHHITGFNNSGNSVKPSIPADYNTPYPEPTTSDYTTVITPVYQA